MSLSTQRKGWGGPRRGRRDSYLIRGLKVPHCSHCRVYPPGGKGELGAGSATTPAALVAAPILSFTKSWIYPCLCLVVSSYKLVREMQETLEGKSVIGLHRKKKKPTQKKIFVLMSLCFLYLYAFLILFLTHFSSCLNDSL